MNVQSALSAAGSVFGIRTAEEPQFQLLVKNGANEIRQYGAFWVVTTVASGGFDAAREEGYRRLADYLAGANSSGLVMAMTSPVMQAGIAGHWKISFVLPTKMVTLRLPAPTSELVHLEGVPTALIATQKFSGRADHDDFERQASDLRQWLRWQSDYLPAADARAAFYDPPFTIGVLRRNEIHVPVHKMSTLH